MNPIRLTLLIILAVFVVLIFIAPKRGVAYARFVLLSITALLMIIPFAWLFCSAFKTPDVLMKYTFLPPLREFSSETVNLGNFKKLFTDEQTVQGPVSFWRYFGNSVFLASTGTLISLMFSSMGGYALAKYKRFRGKTSIATFMLASMAIPGMALLAPAYDVIYHLGWMDSFKSLLVPGCVSVFGIFLFRQAIVGVPDDIIEAGRIDGCGEFRIYLTLIMPLVRPMVGAFILLTFLGWWNSFIGPNIFIQTQGKLTLPVVLNQYLNTYRQEYGVFLAGTLLAIIPPAVLFLALQREFISGLTSGAVKQ